MKIPAEDFTHHVGFPFVDGKIENIADRLIVAVYEVGYFPPFGVDFLAELDTLGSVRALFLSKRAEDRQHEFAVSHARHVCR